MDSTFPYRKADHETRTTLVHRHRGGHGIGRPGAGPGHPCRCPADGQPGNWQLTKQIAYRTEAGNRIPEVQAYGRDSLLVEEATFSTTAGNSEELYAVTGVNAAPDVSTVANLSVAPAKDVVSKKLVANLVACPTLGAPSRETQANPLLDNYEGMTIIGGPGLAGVSLISDDNFSATQFTRVLNLLVKLP